MQGSTTALNEAVLNGHMETVTMLVKALSQSIKKVQLPHILYHLLLYIPI